MEGFTVHANKENVSVSFFNHFLQPCHLQIHCHECVQEIRKKYSLHAKVVVGLDVEWKPVGIFMEPATLQLCIDDKCLILQLFYMDQFPTTWLKSFFLDWDLTFVGVEVEEEMGKLCDEYCLEFRNWEDVRELAKKGERTGLKDLAMMVCNIHLKKPNNVGVSDWEAMTLSCEQVEYACMDSYASYFLGHKLLIG